jgi:branched-chain amino acid aminotransferase
VDVITPPLDGTILPGLTRSSCLSLCDAHPSRTSLSNLPNSLKLYTHEAPISMSDLALWSSQAKLLEAFCVGTAVLVAPVGRIGFEDKDILIPAYKGGLGPVGRALLERIVDIQEGIVEWERWSVVCE